MNDMNIHGTKAVDFPAKLTRQESRCLQFSCQGLTDRQIARRLDLSVHTVRMHLANTRLKLSARSRVEAAAIALSKGLIQLLFVLVLIPPAMAPATARTTIPPCSARQTEKIACDIFSQIL
ncbi:response regulator transcription factor [Rhizobium etli]|uniref:response regulator transcription factor n=1 Tax=Rhizobium etli TaxID=29449 RepID=UPI00093A2C22|nr:helix-turn-helix transcriptional regulator [Rhizobium etli]